MYFNLPKVNDTSFICLVNLYHNFANLFHFMTIILKYKFLHSIFIKTFIHEKDIRF